MEKILYGAAYYDEYMPYDRLKKDVELMKAAGINVIRLGESTWSTCEPQEGVFDFSHILRVMDAMEEAGISVIVGTPTYAVPTWMVKSYPEVIATTKNGRCLYGHRQIMDITHPVYRYYGERIIRKLMETTAHRKCVIGFQVDNETNYYGTAGKNVQEQFVKYLRKKFNNNLEEMNLEFGLDYWSNRINAWEDFPDVRGTINGSLGAEFEKFQREMVNEFLEWQVDIIREYSRDDQFITHNFNYDWKGYTYGMNPFVNHHQAAMAMDVAGVDIYHPTQDKLTGMEIFFGGDSARSMKGKNYLVLETQAQGFPHWLPYEGQLRLQAYSHLACGANMVEYWPWHSIHNACESYWKGVLGHDSKENDVYRSVKKIGNELAEIGSHLVNLKKSAKVAVLISNEALTGINWFPIDGTATGDGSIFYNDVLTWIYKQLYQLNIECDFLWPESEELEKYKLLIVPALYAAPESLLRRIEKFVEQGGHLFTTFKTAFADENLKIYTDCHPHILNKCLGISYSDFTFPDKVKLGSDKFRCNRNSVQGFMELINPDKAEVLATYNHYNWKRYAAITRNNYGKGSATYLGCQIEDEMLREILKDVIKEADLWTKDQEVGFPMIVRRGQNDYGKEIVYYLNFSAEKQEIEYSGEEGLELLTNISVSKGCLLEIGPWDLKIIEYQREA